MAGIALLLRAQWKAYWRRFHRGGGQPQFHLIVSLILAWQIFIKLPPVLSQAAHDLQQGKLDRIEIVLLILGLAWLYPPSDDSGISIAAKNLLRFPLTCRSLLAIRIFSMLISPVTMLLVIGSLMSLFPFLKSRHPLIGIAAAILSYTMVTTVGLCLSHLLVIPAWRKGLLAAAAITIAPLALPLFAGRAQAIQQLRSLIPFTPAHLASSAANSASLQSALIPLLLLLALSLLASFLLFWSLRQSLAAQQFSRSSATKTVSFNRLFGRLAGRLGGLVGKEQRYFRKTLMPWFGFLFALACSFAILKNAIPPIVFQIAILLTFLTNLDLTINVFGLDRPPELYRYLLFPLSGKEIVCSKNLGIVVIAAAQWLPMLSLACWRFGWLEAGFGLVEAAVLTLAHLAWGNWRSVSNPGKLHFYRPFGGSGNVLVETVGLVSGSLPGIAIILLAQSDSGGRIIKMILILMLTAVVYLGSTRYAGRKFEQRWQTVIDRLS